MRLTPDHRVEPVMPPWDHQQIPGMPNTYPQPTPVGPAETPGSPRSTHTDTDTAMELEGLSIAPGGPDIRRVAPRASATGGSS